MNRDQARLEILERSKEYFTPDNSGKGYICPICSSGSGANGTGITTKDGIHFTCWAGAGASCFKNADIFEIVGIERGLTSFPQQLEYLAEYFHIHLDPLQERRTTAREDFAIPIDQSETRAATAPEPVEKQTEPPIDYTDFFLQANKHIQDTDYHRGLSLDTLNRFKVGYVPNWKMPLETYLKGGNGLTSSGKPRTKETWAYIPTSPRLIIPTSKESYLARDTRPADQIPEQAEKYTKPKVGKAHLFNPKALKADYGVIFVVEGEIDAMSIEEVGGHAVGLGSIAYGSLLLQAVKETKPTQPLIIALDNENTQNVKAAAQKLTADLKQAGVNAIVISDIWGRYKDPNEMLQGDRSQLQRVIHEIARDPENWERTQYLNTFADRRTDDFMSWICKQQGTQYTPTGFYELDNILNGGLYNEKLYAVGAISSLGKTTLVMQIADNIARSGRDVLIFSLEMSEFELYGKSVSRLTYEITQREGGDTRNAKTELGITLYERWNDYNADEIDLINRAVIEHRDIIGRHKKVLSGIGGYTVDSIRTATEQHISFTGKAPVIVVDYMQILESTDPRLSDKQKVDHDITALKRLAVEYKTPVLVISALNRQNYKAPISYEAFKESGAIEYSVDVLMGLQLKGVGEPDFNVDKAKQADPREIELVLLKQRQGKTGLKIGFDYYPMFNYFTETGIIENDNYKGDQSEGAGNSSTRYSDRPKIDKVAFKAEWNAIQATQLENGFDDSWRLDQEKGLLAKLDRTSDLYLQYRKKYDKGLKKAEKAAGKQTTLTDKGE